MAGPARPAPSGTGHHATPADAGAPADFIACAAAALIVSATHAALTLLAGAFLTTAGCVGFGRSAMLHLVVFSAIFAMMSVIRGAARLARRHGAAEAWLARVAVAAIVGLFMHRIVLSSLSFTGADVSGGRRGVRGGAGARARAARHPGAGRRRSRAQRPGPALGNAARQGWPGSGWCSRWALGLAPKSLFRASTGTSRSRS